MGKLTSIILLFCILNLLFGCFSPKLLSIDQASAKLNKEKEVMVIRFIQNGYYMSSTYELCNYKFKNNNLEGDLFIRSKVNKPFVLVNAEIDKDTIIQDSRFIRIPFENIKEIIYPKLEVLKTVGLVVGVALVIGTGVSILMYGSELLFLDLF